MVGRFPRIIPLFFVYLKSPQNPLHHFTIQFAEILLLGIARVLLRLGVVGKGS